MSMIQAVMSMAYCLILNESSIVNGVAGLAVASAGICRRSGVLSVAEAAARLY
jgi:hypothetical protein